MCVCVCVNWSRSSSLAVKTHTDPQKPNQKQPYPVNGAKRIHGDRSKVISAAVTEEIGRDTCEELFEGEILKQKKSLNKILKSAEMRA